MTTKGLKPNRASLPDRLAGAVWGHLVGDALGVPYEFGPAVPADEVEFRGHGAHGQPPGTWSDDGALMLALLDSLLAKGFDTTDQAQRALAWYRQGEYAPGKLVFDFGRTTGRALGAFESGVPAEDAGPTDESSCGNGSLMRILPLALVERDTDTETLVDHAHRASRVTHGHRRAQVACALYSLIARSLVNGRRRRRTALKDAQTELRRLYESGHYEQEFLATLDELEGWSDRSGRGYVLDSFWSAWDAFAGADSYESAVRRAVAYGHDTDTTAAIAGGLAGLRWGIDGIPADWLSGMRDKRLVNRLVKRLVDPTRTKYRVYVIQLKEDAWSKRAMQRRNPKPRMDKPCVYVGQTGLTRRQRYRQRMSGDNESREMGRYMGRLRLDLSKRSRVTYTREDAEKAEGEWADHLRARGFRVWEGRLGRLDIKRRAETS